MSRPKAMRADLIAAASAALLCPSAAFAAKAPAIAAYDNIAAEVSEVTETRSGEGSFTVSLDLGAVENDGGEYVELYVYGTHNETISRDLWCAASLPKRIEKSVTVPAGLTAGMIKASLVTSRVYEDAAAAERVIGSINAIGEPELSKRSLIYEARDAFDNLDSVGARYIYNYDKLVEAETAYAELKRERDENVNAVLNTIDLIGAIGAVAIDSEPGIKEARAAYDALSEEQRAFVINYDVLVDAEEEYAELSAGYERALDVVSLIDAIGEVSTEKTAEIAAARAAYNALGNRYRAYVENYDTLVEAESAYKSLCDQYKADLAAAKKVESMIDALGEITLESGADLAAAEAAFDSLTEAAKELVKNIGELEAARQRYDELCREREKAIDDANRTEALKTVLLIQAIGGVTADSGEAIAAARQSYDALCDGAKFYVLNYSDLVAAEERYAGLMTTEAEDDQALNVIYALYQSSTLTRLYSCESVFLEDGAEAELYSAGYDEAGRLTGLNVCSVKQGTASELIWITVSSADAVSLKTPVWHSGAMKPLYPAAQAHCSKELGLKMKGRDTE